MGLTAPAGAGLGGGRLLGGAIMSDVISFWLSWIIHFWDYALFQYFWFVFFLAFIWLLIRRFIHLH